MRAHGRKSKRGLTYFRLPQLHKIGAALIYDEHKNYGVKVSFSSQRLGAPVRIRLTRYTELNSTFYRAHELFSVRTILSVLRGEIPYKRIAQLVEDASRSPKMEEPKKERVYGHNLGMDS